MARKTGLIRPTGGGNTAGLARLADTVCIIAGYVAAVWFYDQADWRTDDTIATLLAVLAYLLVAETTGLYQTWRGVWMVGQQFRNLGELERFGQNLKGNVQAGLKLTALDIAAAEHKRQEVFHRFRALFERFDVLLTPAAPVKPADAPKPG